MLLILPFLLRYARRHSLQYILGLAMLVLTNYAVVHIPALMGAALTELSEQGPQTLEHTQQLARELMIWACVVVIARTLSRIWFFNPGRTIEFRLSVDFFRHLLRLQRPFFAHYKIGELVSVGINDTASIRLLVGFVGLQIFNIMVAIPMHIGQMWRTDHVLTLWCLVPIVVGSFYMRYVVKNFYAAVRTSLEKLASLSDRILESYTGIATIRAFSAENAALERFEGRSHDYLQLQLRLAKIRAFAMPVLSVSGLVGTAFVLWIGGNRVIQDQMEVGDLATFTTLILSLVTLLTAFAWVLAAVSRGLVALERIDQLITTSDDLPEVRDDYVVQRPPRLELRHLSFTYPNTTTPVLHDLNLCLNSGQTLGIFGHTGAGKSTLVQLLTRIYTPPEHTIYVDGHDITHLDLDQLRQSMAVVLQEPFLFSTSIRDNISLPEGPFFQAHDGEHEHSPSLQHQSPDPLLQQVLRDTSLEPDIQRLAHGLDTVVGERGIMLSGGQRQRTALARALYQQPHLLLLDDVLSAVDQTTEARLIAAIRAIKSHPHTQSSPTTVIVSHRIRALEHADEIIVLEQGQIVERGTHEQLLRQKGVYAQAYQHQVIEGQHDA